MLETYRKLLIKNWITQCHSLFFSSGDSITGAEESAEPCSDVHGGAVPGLGSETDALITAADCGQAGPSPLTGLYFPSGNTYCAALLWQLLTVQAPCLELFSKGDLAASVFSAPFPTNTLGCIISVHSLNSNIPGICLCDSHPGEISSRGVMEHKSTYKRLWGQKIPEERHRKNTGAIII